MEPATQNGCACAQELATFSTPPSQRLSLRPTREIPRRSGNGIEVFRRRFALDVIPGRERFLREMESYLAPMSQMETAEFEIVGIGRVRSSASSFDIDIRYDLVGTRKDIGT